MPPRNEFKIGINMAGAISAGAYTAGVLDFLIEALEEWQKAKGVYRTSVEAGTPPGQRPFVPLHDMSIEVFSGASAGGMCAAIASAMVQAEFAHIRTGEEEGTTNTFYESWVNKIDILELLKTRDIGEGKPVTSLLDCTIIDEIADYALQPTGSNPRPSVSPNLTLFLTLSNVRGVPYKLYDDPTPTIEEFVSYYADRLRFEVVRPGAGTSSPTAKPLPIGKPGVGAWPLLNQAAKATGAFPLFLAPRILERETADYAVPMWQVLCGPPGNPVPPKLPSDKTWKTLNVDGGVTNNSPFQLAHDFLASRNPEAKQCHNPREADKANAAVITVAPFPSEDAFNPAYDANAESAILPMLSRLVTVLVSQSRFQGESLEALTSGASFSRFVIAPSDPTRQNENALQCALLGAFGGFFERGFRVHDFLLGRRNCQRFLEVHLCFPVANPIIADGLQSAGGDAVTIQNQWCIDAPNPTVQPQGRVWMPLIPLCGTAKEVVAVPARAKISEERIGAISDAVLERLGAVGPSLTEGAPVGAFLRFLLGAATSFPFRYFARKKLSGALREALGPNAQ